MQAGTPNCRYYGCNDPSATNYDVTSSTLVTSITHLCNGSGLGSACTYSGANTHPCNNCCSYCPSNPTSINTSSSTLDAEVDSSGDWNGEIVLSGFSSSTMSSVWTYSGSYTSSVIFPSGDTMTDAPPGVYDVTVTQVTGDETCSWTISGITITEIIYGCTTSTANNYCGCTGGSGCNTQGSGYNYDSGNITYCNGTCTYDVGGCNDSTALNHLYDCSWASNSNVTTNNCSGFNICEYCDGVNITGVVSRTHQVRRYNGSVVPGSINIGNSEWNIGGLSGGVAGDKYSVWLTKDGDANGTQYDSEDGLNDPLLTTNLQGNTGQYAANPNSHIFPLSVPTSVFTNVWDKDPTDDMEVHVTTYGTWGATSDLNAHKCDSVLIDDFEQHIYGCMNTDIDICGDCEFPTVESTYNYDPSVTHAGFSPTNTNSPCATCSHNPFTINNDNDGDVRVDSQSITPDNIVVNGSGNGQIAVTFKGFASNPSGTITSYTIYVVGTSDNALNDVLIAQNTQLSAIGIGTFAQNTSTGTYEYTHTFTGLDWGTYQFSFTSTRTHIRHDGSNVSTTCTNNINIEVPQG